MALHTEDGHSDWRYIFNGPQGLRAGWSIAIFVTFFVACNLAVVGVAWGLKHWAHLNIPAGNVTQLTPPTVIAQDGLATLILLAAMAMMSKIERRPMGLYGLGGPDRIKNFLIGAGGGFGSLSALVAVLYAIHAISFDGVALAAQEALIYGVYWFAAFFLVGMGEELLMRGFLQYTLTRGLGFWPASAMTSGLFAALHMGNGGESILGLLQIVVFGLVFCVVLRQTGSLWMGIGFHAAWDWGQSFYYGTQDSGLSATHHFLISHPLGNPQWSGGSDGPEGSLLITPTLILVMIAMLAIHRLFSSRPTPPEFRAVI